MLLGLSLLALAIWLYLTTLHGRFWLSDQRLDPDTDARIEDGSVVAVVPARNEADVIALAIRSLLSQGLSVVLVDDGSSDGTADQARAAAREESAEDRLTILRGATRPAGWTGKVWAMHQGAGEAAARFPGAGYWLLTDADIAHAPGNAAALKDRAETGGLVLVSQMAMLHCQGGWERFLIPAFVYFFQLLYPFPQVNRPDHRMAAAAGGCMLVRRDALKAAGGLASIQDRIIDDCALGAALKRQGPIWLGLTARTRSLRPYGGLPGIWSMVARTAFVQLRHSPLLLALTVLGMALTYLIAPASVAVGALVGAPALLAAGAAAWGLMALTYWPTVRLYGLSPAWALTLPGAAVLYNLMTLDSARRHWSGRGGQWKGRVAGGMAPEDGE